MVPLLLIAIPINILGIIIGKLLTENDKFAISYLSKKLDRKPFNCKPCLTFHILWITYLFVSLYTHSWALFAVGIVFSFVIFGVLYFAAKSKIVK